MFTIPVSDDNPTRVTPFVTWALIGINVAVFLWQVTLPPGAQRAAIYSFGVIPAVLFGGEELPPELAVVPPWLSVVTSMFLHGGWMHLIGNMLFLWIFGNNVEESMGHARYVAFYLVCGTAAALAQSWAAPESVIPMVGASGAIGGVLGAYILLHPQANVRVLFVLFLFVRLFNVPAVIVLGIWFVMQLASGWTTAPDEGGVAFWAHVGGFLAGMALIPVLKRREARLFDRPHSRPFEVVHRRPGAKRGSVPSAGRTPWRGRRGRWP